MIIVFLKKIVFNDHLIVGNFYLEWKTSNTVIELLIKANLAPNITNSVNVYNLNTRLETRANVNGQLATVEYLVSIGSGLDINKLQNGLVLVGLYDLHAKISIALTYWFRFNNRWL